MRCINQEVARFNTPSCSLTYSSQPKYFFQVELFWVVKPCSVAVGCQHFRGPCIM